MVVSLKRGCINQKSLALSVIKCENNLILLSEENNFRSTFLLMGSEVKCQVSHKTHCKIGTG